ncbi:MAG: class I SAM-dependent methyltransferase [Chryseosolibacter sp.]
MKKETKEILEALSHGPVQQFILEHEKKDIRDLVLKNKVLFGIPTAQLIEQIATRRKAKTKLPLYYNTPGIIFPPPGNFEQSSSEATAKYKNEMIAALAQKINNRGADLTGGFGVDTYFFSTTFGEIHYVEPQASLLEIARYNHELLGARNIQYHAATAEDFITGTDTAFDFIYLDPSRRTAEKKKVHALDDAQPDVLKLKDELFKRTSLIVVKASPLFDLQAGISQLGCVKRVCVISVDNECKELLFCCEKDFTDEPVIIAANISERERGNDSFEFTFREERAETIHFHDPLTYLYEPNAAILKAGAFKSVAKRFSLKKIQTNTHLYTSEELVRDFPGRIFFVEALVKPEPGTLKKYFPEGKANVTTRNYPLTPEALKKKTGLQDGGEKFLIGFSGEKKKFLAVASRLSHPFR